MAAVTVTIAFGGLAAHAVPIYSLGKITTESDVLNTGDVLRAINLGGNSVTVNGVTFATSSAVTEISGMRRGSGDFNTEFVPNSPLDQILSDSWFQDGSFSSLTLSGLVVGQDYIFQMLISNEVNSTGQSSRITLQDERFNLSGVYDGSAHELRAAFTATATAEVVRFGTGSTAISQRMQFSAFSLQAVPEPETALLVSCGLLGLLWAGNRKRTGASTGEASPQ